MFKTHQLFYYSAFLLAFRNCHVTAKETVRFNEIPLASILPRDTMSWIAMEGSKSNNNILIWYILSMHILMLWQGYIIIHYTTLSFKIISFYGIAYLGAVDTHIFGIRQHYHVESIVYPEWITVEGTLVVRTLPPSGEKKKKGLHPEVNLQNKSNKMLALHLSFCS